MGGSAQCDALMALWERGEFASLARSVSSIFCVSSGLVAAALFKILSRPGADAALVAELRKELPASFELASDPQTLFCEDLLRDLHARPPSILRRHLGGKDDVWSQGCPVSCYYYKDGHRCCARLSCAEDFAECWRRTSALPWPPLFDPTYLDGVNVDAYDVCAAFRDAPTTVLRMTAPRQSFFSAQVDPPRLEVVDVAALEPQHGRRMAALGAHRLCAALRAISVQ